MLVIQHWTGVEYDLNHPLEAKIIHLISYIPIFSFNRYLYKHKHSNDNSMHELDRVVSTLLFWCAEIVFTFFSRMFISNVEKHEHWSTIKNNSVHFFGILI